ncbi:MAG: DnaA regulatory inactivator Hda [Pseudomonadales bacterium]|nr:DnaA regulatory inactivator Hda [Pseudomonadales bacterium]
MREQIPLLFPLRCEATFDNFVALKNKELTERLLKLVDEKPTTGVQTIWLWGEPGVGCSHLLNACCHLLSEKGRRVGYIPSRDWNLQTDSLAGYQNFDMVAIDDIDLWLNRSAPERSLIELYQSLQISSGILLLAAHKPPADLDYAFADMASRFIAAETYRVLDLSDIGKMLFVQSEAKRRGIDLEDGVASFMLTRCSRQLQELVSLLNKLDSESLALKRKVTIPFLKQVLDL